MVLVDTSVWLRVLRDELPYAAEMSRLLDNDKVAGHELVYGELLIGGQGGSREASGCIFAHAADGDDHPHRCC